MPLSETSGIPEGKNPTSVGSAQTAYDPLGNLPMTPKEVTTTHHLRNAAIECLRMLLSLESIQASLSWVVGLFVPSQPFS